MRQGLTMINGHIQSKAPDSFDRAFLTLCSDGYLIESHSTIVVADSHSRLHRALI